MDPVQAAKLRASRDILASHTSFSEAAIERAVHLHATLGLPSQYFSQHSSETIARHIASLSAARELVRSSGQKFEAQLQAEDEDSAFFAARSSIFTDLTGTYRRQHVSPSLALERYIEAKYLSQGENTAIGEDVSSGLAAWEMAKRTGIYSLSAGPSVTAAKGVQPFPWRLQCYRSKGVLDGAHLRLYFLQQPHFPAAAASASPVSSSASSTSASAIPSAPALETVCDPRLLATADATLQSMYQLVLNDLADPSRLAPSIQVRTIRDTATGEDEDVGGAAHDSAPQEVESVLLVVGHKVGSTHSLFTGATDVYRYYGLYATTKLIEVFANGVIAFAFKLRLLDYKRAAAVAAAAASSALSLDGNLTSGAQAMGSVGTPLPAAWGATPTATAAPTPLSLATPSASASGSASASASMSSSGVQVAVASGSGSVTTTTTHRALGSVTATTLDGLLQQQAHTRIASLAMGSNEAPAVPVLPIAVATVGASSGSGTAPVAGPAHIDSPFASAADRRAATSRASTGTGTGMRIEPAGGSDAAPSALSVSPSPLSDRIDNMVRDIALHFVLPRTSLTPLLTQGILSAQEVSYAYCAWKFAFHFITRMAVEINTLTALLKGSTMAGALGSDRQAEALSLVSRLRKNVQSHSFTESQILEAMFAHPDTMQWLYDQFHKLHKPTHTPGSPGGSPLSYTEGVAHLKKTIKSGEDDLAIFTSMLAFNHAVLKTNFYKPNIAALAFRLQPDFLSADFPDKPHGVFMVIGAEFRGFHTRFADVARGGIRLIKSASPQAYANNVSGLFEECYGLARTQQRKNKDIPEGGSKGVILLTLGHQDKGQVAFAKYVDAMLDVLLTPHPHVNDRLGATEILFFGPDENTAEYMDFACMHARQRGYPYWKAITTGKSLTLGGIPHDIFGMTTRGVRAYVTGIQRKLGLDPARLTKVQTGGPDGDLGSNEIKLGNETTIAVVDGSGVLCDPDGLNGEELTRLATKRKMVKFFDRRLLGPKGFLVLVEETDVRLPDGTLVPSGLLFRNNFHLNPIAKGDFFVPCGGRPAAVNADNVDAFLYGATKEGGDACPTAAATGSSSGDASPDGSSVLSLRKPRFRYIVEGANLFFTNDARLAIEARGVVLFKDSAANKGGVTSSSLEVMAALALTDKEFHDHMCVAPDAAAATPASAGSSTTEDSHGASLHLHAPAFYKQYVAEVQAVIEANATAEFECLWREHARTGRPISELSDALSQRITDLSTRIETSPTLWANEALRTAVLQDAVPRSLASLVGGADVIIARLPVNYLRALFGSRLASRFYYAFGLATEEFTFYEYVATMTAKAAKPAFVTLDTGNGLAVGGGAAGVAKPPLPSPVESPALLIGQMTGIVGSPPHVGTAGTAAS